MIELLLFPLIAGCLIAMVSGPLGCFVTWNRMAYFSDTLAHSALMGVSFALLLSMNTTAGILLACFIIAFALLMFRDNNLLPRDTLLGIFAHGSLAMGIVFASFIKGMQIDLMAFLFGDILSVNKTDVLSITIVCLVIGSLLFSHWQKLISVSLDAELAQVEGIQVQRYRQLLMLLLAGLIAFSIKIIGVLLIGALLIIPAAAARVHAHSPERMALVASLVALFSVATGLLLSWFLDTPAGPSIVLMSFSLFIFSSLISAAKNRAH